MLYLRPESTSGPLTIAGLPRPITSKPEPLEAPALLLGQYRVAGDPSDPAAGSTVAFSFLPALSTAHGHPETLNRVVDSQSYEDTETRGRRGSKSLVSALYPCQRQPLGAALLIRAREPIWK